MLWQREDMVLTKRQSWEDEHWPTLKIKAICNSWDKLQKEDNVTKPFGCLYRADKPFPIININGKNRSENKKFSRKIKCKTESKKERKKRMIDEKEKNGKGRSWEKSEEKWEKEER